MRTTRQHPTRRERGTALVPALLFAMTAMAFAMSVVTSGLAVNHQRRYLVAGQRAQDAAESGIHHLLGALAGPGRLAVLTENRLEGVLAGDETSAVALLSAGDAPRDEKLKPPELAAWTQLTATVLASDIAILLY